MKVFLKRGPIDNLMICRAGVVNDKFMLRSRSLGRGGLWLEKYGSAY
jgi:hypothetical protein